jgi:hypothetical protein
VASRGGAWSSTGPNYYYDNDTRWEQFMGRMKEFARQKLVCSQTLVQTVRRIWGELEWKVQEDPGLKNCTKEVIWWYTALTLPFPFP